MCQFLLRKEVADERGFDGKKGGVSAAFEMFRVLR